MAKRGSCLFEDGLREPPAVLSERIVLVASLTNIEHQFGHRFQRWSQVVRHATLVEDQ